MAADSDQRMLGLAAARGELPEPKWPVPEGLAEAVFPWPDECTCPDCMVEAHEASLALARRAWAFLCVLGGAQIGPVPGNAHASAVELTLPLDSERGRTLENAEAFDAARES